MGQVQTAGQDSQGSAYTNTLANALLVGSKAGSNALQLGAGSAVRATINGSTGNFGIGDTSPASLLTVGSGDLFQVDSNGDIVKLKNVTYSWPSSQGAASSVLTNNGSGTLSWGTLGAASITADSLDFTEFKDAMALDASTDIAVTGSNELSVTNTGSGNSLVVNDAASDTTPFVIDASGNVTTGGNVTATGHVLPAADDTYDLGSSSFRWRDLYLGPTSLHIASTAGETTTPRDWTLSIDETDGATEGNFRIREGSNQFITVTPTGASTFQNSADSTAAFVVNSAATTDVLKVDTTNSLTTTRGINSTATLGAELANNNFSTSWTGAGWTLGASSATHTNGGGTTALSPNPAISVTAGAYYQIVFTISGWTTGTVTPQIGGVNGSAIAANSTNQTKVILTTGTGNLGFVPSNTFDGTISAVSVKQLTPSNSVLTVKNSDDTVGLEVRAGGSALQNTFVGLAAGQSSTSGNNTAVGYIALRSNTAGVQNTATGSFALQGNTTGGGNTAVGYNALPVNTSGNQNTGFGYQALVQNTTGSSNTAIGRSAGFSNTTGDNNTFVGNQAGAIGTTGTISNSTAIGQQAQVTASNALILGGTGASNYVNVGIGLTAPTARLHVLDSNPGSATTLLVNNSTSTGTIADIQDNGTTVFDIIDGGNVGIGIAAPTSLLHVTGSQPASVAGNGTNATQVLQVTGGQGGNTSGTTGQTAGTGAAANITSGAGGNATGASGANIGGAGGGITIQSGAGGNVTSASGTNGSGGSITLQGGAAGTGGTGGSRGNILLQTSGGNVGIGTTTPQTFLNVKGNTATYGTESIQGTAAGASNIGYISFIDSSNARTGYIGDASSGNSSIYLQSDSGDVLLQPTSGNVGIGVTSGINSKLTFAADTTAAGGILFGTDTNLYRAGTDTLRTDSRFDVRQAASTDTAITTAVTGDAVSRLIIRTDGQMTWSDGSAAGDTNLYRSAADTLKTDDNFTVGGNLTITGTCTGCGSGGTLQQAYDAGNTITTTDGRNIAITLADTATDAQVTVTSDLSVSGRTTYPMVISQADNATFNNSVGLLQLNNQDTGSTAGVLQVTQAATGTAIAVTGPAGGTALTTTGITSGTAINASTITTGTAINANGVSTGQGVSATGVTTGQVIAVDTASTATTAIGLRYIADANSLTTGSAVSVSGSSSAITADYTGAYLNVAPTRTHTAAATRTDSGNFMNLTRANTVNGASAVYNLTGAVANIQSSMTETSGTATDSSNILQVAQNCGTGVDCSGNVLQVTSGANGNYTGRLALFDASNTGQNGVAIDVQSSSSSQYALNVTSNNGSSNILYARGDGRLGIGNTSPAALLSVGSSSQLQVDASGNTTYTTSGTTVDLASTDGNTFNLKIPRRSSSDCGSGVAEGLVVQNGSGTQVGHICINNNTFSGAVNKLRYYADQFNASSTDVAENYSDASNSLAAGELVVIDNATHKGVQKSQKPYQSSLVGIVSTSPGIHLSDISEDGGQTDLINPKPIALSGRVPTKVSTANGPITKGDPITTSNTPGVGMKATSPGRIVGIALENFSGSGEGKILVYVNPTWFTPSDSEGNTRVGNSNQGCIQTEDGTVIGGTCLADAGLQTNLQGFDPVLDKFAQLRAVKFNWSPDADPNYQLGGSLQYGLVAQEVEKLFPELVSTNSQGDKNLNYQALSIYNLQATKELAVKVDSLESRVGQLETQQAAAQTSTQQTTTPTDSTAGAQTQPTTTPNQFDNIEVTNLTSTKDLEVTGTATVAELKVTGTLTTENLKVSGVATVQNLMVLGHIIGNVDTRGSVSIAAGQTTITHTFSTAYGSAPYVVISPTGPTGVDYWVTKTATGFTIHLSEAADHAINFDYMVQQ